MWDTPNWKKRCLVKRIYNEWCDLMVFCEAGKLASLLRHCWDSINTGYPNLLKNLLSNENILDISIWNWIASSSVLSSQNSIVLHCSWLTLFIRQRFINQGYTRLVDDSTLNIMLIFCSDLGFNMLTHIQPATLEGPGNKLVTL